MAKKLTKILLYPVTIEACEEGGYFATCPSLQGCHAEGESYSEVIENIEDVIKAHLEIRKKHKEFIPEVIIKDRKAIDVNLPILVRV
jgi:predicted RNase H-like HicB family nuclease